MAKMQYIPRKDFVMIQVINRGFIGKIATPEISKQGKDLIVFAVGPDVKDLNVGDKVMCVGQVGQDLVFLADRSDVFMTKESNVCYRIVEEEIIDLNKEE